MIDYRRERAHMLSLERLDFDRCDWENMDALPDRVVFQTRAWLEFVARTQGAEPMVAAVLGDGQRVGYFTGLIVRRFRVRILGSPFPGWSTPWMGFNFETPVDPRAAAQALERFAFGPLRCAHLELHDRALPWETLPELGFQQSPSMTFELDLSRDEDQLLAAMTGACRRALRKAERVGVTVEEAAPEGFAEEFHTQLEDVFGKQGLRPTYGVDRVRELIRYMHPTGRLLLVRAVSPDGERIASAIFPALNGLAHFWGGASWRSHQILRPNEAVFWFAMRYWKARGVTLMDMGGGGEYKRRYGPRESRVPFFRKSRLPVLGRLRDLGDYALRQRAARSR
jgi:hypothetical protein